MDKKHNTYLVVLLIFSNILVGSIALLEYSAAKAAKEMPSNTLGSKLLIDPNQAINIAKNNETISEFLKSKFKNPNLRLERVSLVQEKSEKFMWKVELFERSCACPGDRKAYIATALINPETGTVENVDARERLESEISKGSCRTEHCHIN
ncbi:MAG TPA: hypothetical protein EYP22_01725 [Methanosarcinales archaeon]|nr:hypothetical protein [Methanosarcinales archaeon]